MLSTANRFTLTSDSWANAFLIASSLISLSRASANLSVSAGGTSMPVLPSSTISAGPVSQAKLTIGRPPPPSPARHHALDDTVQTDWTEVLLIGAIDAGIMAQNMVLTAESLGLGAVYIGSIRNDIARVGELLGLPEHVVPLFGVCLGHPDQDPLQRPRLPLETLVSENRYCPAAKTVLEDYNETVKTYYRERSGKDLDWAQQVRNTLGRPVRPFMLDYLRKQGFAKR